LYGTVRPSHCGGARVGIFKIAADDLRTAHQQFAHRLAAARLLPPGIVDNLDLDAENGPTLLLLDYRLSLAVEAQKLGLRRRRAVVRSGLISVIPQPWRASMP